MTVVARERSMWKKSRSVFPAYHNQAGSPSNRQEVSSRFRSEEARIFSRRSSYSVWLLSVAVREKFNGGPVLLCQNCAFSNNVASSGGGSGNGGAINFASTQMSLSNCTFVGNVSAFGGGAVFDSGTAQNTLANCSFIANSAGAASGGAVYRQGAYTSLVVNCTFFTNTVSGSIGGAIRTETAGSSLAITNCIFRNDIDTSSNGKEINLAGALNMSYCSVNTNLITGGTRTYGSGITNAAPLFANAIVPYDVHLQSQGGRWTPVGWVNDAQNSPCIDAGDPASDYSREPQPNGGRINMGAYGNTTQASKSRPVGTCVILE